VFWEGAGWKPETALWRMMSFYDTPLAELDARVAQIKVLGSYPVAVP
jgi:hypothetical protein